METDEANDEIFEDQDLSDLSVPILFGRFLVRIGEIDQEALDRALRVQGELNHQLGCAALEAGVLAPEVWLQCRRHQREHALTFLEAASVLGVLNEPGIRHLTALMAETHLQLGEILVRQGSLEPQRLASLLRAFSGHL
jgi:hypothetical protein